MWGIPDTTRTTSGPDLDVMNQGFGVSVSKPFFSIAMLLLALAVVLPHAQAAVSSATSNAIAVDNTLPIILVAPVDTIPIYRPDDVIPFHWDTSDENQSTFPQDFEARTVVEGQLIETISFFPQVDQYDWNWVIPDGYTGKCWLEVEVVDSFGNTAIAVSSRFTILSNASGVPRLPGELFLGDPCPNPFNPATVLSLSLPRSGPVSLTVFNLRGHKVRDLMQGMQPAGEMQVQWNGQDQAGRPVPAGVYFFLGKFLDSQGAPTRLVRRAVLLP